MRRIRLATGPRTLFIAMFAIAMVVFLPMRLALGWFGLGEQGLTARRVTGSVWDGGLREAKFGEVALGDLAAGVRPLPLLIGRGSVTIEGPALDAVLEVTRHGVGLRDATATLPIGQAFDPVPVTALSLGDVTARFEGDTCEEASGQVRATLSGDVQGVPLPTALTGAARCDNGALLLPLASAAAGEGIVVRVFGDGRYRTELTLVPGDPLVGQRLTGAGFVPGGAGYVLAIEGRF